MQGRLLSKGFIYVSRGGRVSVWPRFCNAGYRGYGLTETDQVRLVLTEEPCNSFLAAASGLRARERRAAALHSGTDSHPFIASTC